MLNKQTEMVMKSLDFVKNDYIKPPNKQAQALIQHKVFLDASDGRKETQFLVADGHDGQIHVKVKGGTRALQIYRIGTSFDVLREDIACEIIKAMAIVVDGVRVPIHTSGDKIFFTKPDEEITPLGGEENRFKKVKEWNHILPRRMSWLQAATEALKALGGQASTKQIIYNVFDRYNIPKDRYQNAAAGFGRAFHGNPDCGIMKIRRGVFALKDEIDESTGFSSAEFDAVHEANKQVSVEIASEREEAVGEAVHQADIKRDEDELLDSVRERLGLRKSEMLIAVITERDALREERDFLREMMKTAMGS